MAPFYPALRASSRAGARASSTSPACGSGAVPTQDPGNGIQSRAKGKITYKCLHVVYMLKALCEILLRGVFGHQVASIKLHAGTEAGKQLRVIKFMVLDHVCNLVNYLPRVHRTRCKTDCNNAWEKMPRLAAQAHVSFMYGTR